VVDFISRFSRGVKYLEAGADVHSNSFKMSLISSAKTGPATLARVLTVPGIASGSPFSTTVKPLPGEGIVELFTRLAAQLAEAEIVHLMVFGAVSASPAAEEAMRRVFGPTEWPVTWVDGGANGLQPIDGLQAFAVGAGQMVPIMLNGRVTGSVFVAGGFRHCLLGGLGPETVIATRPDQVRQTLENLEATLDLAGFSFGDVARTWFYLDDLLSWYGAFNQVRTSTYGRLKFRNGSLPASTGISGRNPAGAALVVGAWALQPLNAAARVVEVASPLQCAAPAYGSSFSRAMEITSPQDQRLLISGTASIAPAGQTLWQGDIARQIDLTMEVVEAILQSRGFDFSDVTRATAYCKNPAVIPQFLSWCDARELRSFPVVTTQCGICRDDLLFELEADAWKASPGVH